MTAQNVSRPMLHSSVNRLIINVVKWERVKDVVISDSYKGFQQPRAKSCTQSWQIYLYQIQYLH